MAIPHTLKRVHRVVIDTIDGKHDYVCVWQRGREQGFAILNAAVEQGYPLLEDVDNLFVSNGTQVSSTRRRSPEPRKDPHPMRCRSRAHA